MCRTLIARMLSHRFVVVATAALLLAGLPNAQPASAAPWYPDPGVVAGSTFIHDPSMVIKSFDACDCGGDPRYLVFGTDNQERASEDRISFAHAGFYFPLTPDWWQAYSADPNVLGRSAVWA